MEDKDNKPTPAPTPTPAPAPAKAPKEPEVETVTVQTTGSFQLYDPTSQITYKVGEKVTRPVGDHFVQTNLTRGKLKKVK